MTNKTYDYKARIALRIINHKNYAKGYFSLEEITKLSTKATKKFLKYLDSGV